MALNHGPCVLGQVVGQVMQGASSRQFLADLRHRGINGVSTGTAMAAQRPITGIEVYDHLAVIAVFSGFERQFPAMCGEFFHGLILFDVRLGGQGSKVTVRLRLDV